MATVERPQDPQSDQGQPLSTLFAYAVCVTLCSPQKERVPARCATLPIGGFGGAGTAVSNCIEPLFNRCNKRYGNGYNETEGADLVRGGAGMRNQTSRQVRGHRVTPGEGPRRPLGRLGLGLEAVSRASRAAARPADPRSPRGRPADGPRTTVSAVARGAVPLSKDNNISATPVGISYLLIL